VTVRYATADGSATVAGGDYQAASGTLTFNPGGPLTQTVTVLVNGDRVYEDGETFSVNLSNPGNAFVADGTGVGTIADDEPVVGIAAYVSRAEGNTGTTPFAFTVTLSAAYDAPVSVSYATAGLTTDEEYWYGPGATAGVDYAAAAGTVTFAAGETSKTITVLVNGDRLGESDESFTVNLTGATGARIGSGQAFGTILNDEPYVGIGGGGTVLEGNSGTKNVTFTVTLSAASDAPVSVAYATADGSATAGSDYVAASGTLTFAAGETSKTVTVAVKGDRVGEADEYFSVSLTGAAGALVSGGSGYATIRDDEPRLGVNSVSVTEGNRGTPVIPFTVTLSAAYAQAVTDNYATHDSSATVADNDYVATAGTLTFVPGQTTKTFTVVVKGDKKKEADESFYVLLSGASTNAFVDTAYGWGSILNDDGPGGSNGKQR
jgi:chitinase